MPAMMRAAVVREHGGYDRVRVEEVPKPEIGHADEVIVRIRACALNRLDVFVRQGISGPGLRRIRLPRITGVDAAGEVVEVGPAAGDWRPGDRVVIYPGLTCGRCEHCQRGEDTMCQSYRIWGEDVDGGLAEYARISGRNLYRIPSNLPWEVAAAFPCAYTTAWRMTVTVGRLRPYERVLVLGAGGGVGTAAVQIARRIGAYVFAVTSGSERVARLQELGANRVIDRRTEDFEEVVARETGGRGVDLVVNPVGGETWGPAIRSLAMGGRMTICGATAGDRPDVSIRTIYQWHRQILGAPMGNRADFQAVLDLVTRGEIQPVIGAVLPLDDIARAHRMLEEGQVVGKIVVQP